jgi:hypothetical protein
MVHNDFNWDKKTWSVDYEAVFEKLKEGIRNSITLFFPDYSLVWVLRTDASDIACGAVLYQVYITPNG